MEIAPLALVVLLGYGLLVAASLTTWTAVTYRDEQITDVSRSEPKKSRPAKPKQLSNDDVRGARSRRARRGSEMFENERSVPELPERQAEPAVSFDPGRTQRTGGAPENRPPLKRKPVTVTSEDTEEDAFERFLGARPDDFDIR